MTRTGNVLRRLVRDESGQDLIEYALIATVVALGAMVSMRNVASGVSGIMTRLSTTLTGAV